ASVILPKLLVEEFANRLENRTNDWFYTEPTNLVLNCLIPYEIGQIGRFHVRQIWNGWAV
ncbi:hypothetical protein KI387_002153, partial [Taxus chinensis]